MAGKHVNDPAKVVIGSKSRWAAQSSTKNKYFIENPKPENLVDFYVDGTFIEKVSRPIASRFSKTFSAAFPNPADNAPATESYGPVKIEKATAGIGNLSFTLPGEGGPAQRSNHQLNLKMNGVLVQPDVESFKEAYSWMKANVNKPPSVVELYPFCLEVPGNQNFKNSVEWYAASQVLQMRPPAQVLRSSIMKRLTDDPPSLREVMCLRERLAVLDPIVTRGITSYWEWLWRDAYSEEEMNAVDEYVSSKRDAFFERFWEIGQAVQKKYKVPSKARSLPKATVDASEDVGGEVEDDVDPAAAESSDEFVDAREKWEESKSKTNRRQRGRKGKATPGLGRGGKPVPGAN